MVRVIISYDFWTGSSLYSVVIQLGGGAYIWDVWIIGVIIRGVVDILPKMGTNGVVCVCVCYVCAHHTTVCATIHVCVLRLLKLLLWF